MSVLNDNKTNKRKIRTTTNHHRNIEDGAQNHSTNTRTNKNKKEKRIREETLNKDKIRNRENCDRGDTHTPKARGKKEIEKRFSFECQSIDDVSVSVADLRSARGHAVRDLQGKSIERTWLVRFFFLFRYFSLVFVSLFIHSDLAADTGETED